MDEKVGDVLVHLGEITNLMQVLIDSLELSFHVDRQCSYQHSFAKIILNELDDAREELDMVECQLCALKKEQE